MLVFRMLCRITQSSDTHRTESVSVMDYEQTVGVNSRVLDQKQQNILGHISLFWSSCGGDRPGCCRSSSSRRHYRCSSSSSNCHQ